MKNSNVPSAPWENINLKFYSPQKVLLSILMMIFFTFVGYGQQSASFITIWKTDNPGNSTNTQIIIPASGEFDYTWEEVGNFSNSGSGSGTDETLIDFGSSGTYQVSIVPKEINPFQRMEFNDSGDKNKLLEINQWGDVEWISFEDGYYGAANLEITAVDIPNLNNVTSLKNVFRDTAISTVPNMNSWNTENITDMWGVFALARNFNEDIGSWNTQAVVSMSGMFFGASAFNQDIGQWNVENVTDMSWMFAGALSFNQEIGNWTLKSSTNTEEFTSNCGMDCDNYSLTLKGFAQNPNIGTNINLWVDGLHYQDNPQVEGYRSYLRHVKGWRLLRDIKGCQLAVDPIVKIAFDVYPNPTKDLIYINGLEGSETIRIFDLNGRLLHSLPATKQEESLDMTRFARGIYFLNIESENQIRTTKKIIKQ
jgi:surface protein